MKNRYFIFGLLIIAIAVGALGILWANHLPPFGEWRVHKTATLVTAAVAASDAAGSGHPVTIGYRSAQHGTVESVDPSKEMLDNGNAFMVCAKHYEAKLLPHKKNTEIVGVLSPDHTLFFCGGSHKGECCIVAYQDSDDVKKASENSWRIKKVEPDPAMELVIYPDKYIILHTREH